VRSLGVADGEDAVLFSVFYDSLKHLRELHRSGAGFAHSAGKVESQVEFKDVVPNGFSGEEFAGKFVDLNVLHLRFMNLPREKGGKKRKRTSYLNYLRGFADFENVGGAVVKGHEYLEYVKALLEYLSDYQQRINPLYPVEKIHRTLELEFEKISGEDQRIKLFCLPCNKQFAKDTVFNAHLSGNKHLKNIKVYLEKKALSSSNSTIPSDTIPLLEFKIYYFRELLKERVLATIQFVESIQTKTYSEILAERTYEPEIEEESEHESDEEQAIYNPLKIPLGWDGKPIPYWLYKLHGLNIEYKCEICGDFSYWGRKPFQNFAMRFLTVLMHSSCI
jgi:splicing factor 3A subunit 3